MVERGSGSGPSEPARRHGLEVLEWRPPQRSGRAALVLLHEALGSASLWRGLPRTLARRTGRRTVAWSRHGHGRSDPLPAPRGHDYLDREVALLPRVLDATLGVDRPVLVGHSDGATIALLHAAAVPDAVTGLVLVAPHVVVEDVTLRGVAATRDRAAVTDLVDRLARHHDDAPGLFAAWHGTWLDAGFRDWDVTDRLSSVRAPTLVVQAQDDEYATLRQLDLVEAGVAGPVRRYVPAHGGHSPHLDPATGVLDEIVDFLADLP